MITERMANKRCLPAVMRKRFIRFSHFMGVIPLFNGPPPFFRSIHEFTRKLSGHAFFRPFLLIITLPINILTLGFFTFVINAILLMMASGVIPGFEVAGFWSAVFGSLFISLISWFITSFINERGTVQYIDLKHKGGNRWE